MLKLEEGEGGRCTGRRDQSKRGRVDVGEGSRTCDSREECLEKESTEVESSVESRT